MKICLINPPTTVEGASVYFPMALVTLGAVLKQAGLSVEVVDFDLQSRKRALLGASLYQDWSTFRDYAMRQLDGTDAELFGISSICSNYPIALLLAREIRNIRPDAKIILGGPQPSAVPEETLKACPWIDVIVIGEGEETLLELARSYFASPSPLRGEGWGEGERLRGIAGIAFREGDRIVANPKRTPIDDLDTIPFPDFSLVNLPDYLDVNPKLALIEAGRGCPFQCTFCSTSLMWDRRFRMKSPARILEEMRFLSKTYGLREFGLTHDNFTTSPRHLKEFCRFFEENNREGFTWTASAHPNIKDDGFFDLLKRGGCSGLFMGVETGSVEMQERVRKNLDLGRFRRNLTEAASLGIKVTTSFVAGFPDETENDLDETIRLVLWSKRAGANEIQIHRLFPLAGTAIYEETKTELVWDGMSANAALLPVRGPEIEVLIRTYPALFSSFYSLPLREIGSVELSAAAVFYDTLINRLPVELDQLLSGTEEGPVSLFRRWWGWRERHYPDRVVDGSFVADTFMEFVVEEFLGSEKVSLDEERAEILVGL